MKINNVHILLLSILSHHIFIILQNTSSLHGIPLPSLEIWTFLLILPVIYLLVTDLMIEPAEKPVEKLLYFAIVLSIGGSILRILNFSVVFTSYAVLLTLIGICIVLASFFLTHKRMRFYSLILTLSLLILVVTSFNLKDLIIYIGPILELVIVLGLIYYNLSFTQRSDEFFVIIIVTIIGYQLGMYIETMDVLPLIINTVLEQSLNVGQYSLTSTLTPSFFFALHLAEIFNILILFLFKGRSHLALAIILTGLDMSYPPVYLFRAIAILMFYQHTGSKVSSISDLKKSFTLKWFKQDK